MSAGASRYRSNGLALDARDRHGPSLIGAPIYQVFGRDYQAREVRRPYLSGMTQKTGDPDLPPSLRALYEEARILRDTVLRRIEASGYEIDEKSLLEAQAIVSANIGALVAAPEFEILLGYSPREARIIALLVQSCAAEIAGTIGPSARERRKTRVRRGTPLRLVADNER